MEDFIEISRYVLPIIAIAIIVYCIPSLIKGNKEIGITAYLHNEANGDQIPLSGYEVSIGRSKVCDIVLGYGTVSRFHAVLSKHKDGWRVTDTMSKTGTYINAEKIEKPKILKDGDTLVFGNAVFRFVDNAVIVPTQEKETIREPQHNNTMADAGYYQNSVNGVFLIDVNRNEAYRIDGLDTCMIGSGNDVQIKLYDKNVSEHHAMLILDNGEWKVNDMDSVNGTRLNGRPLRKLSLIKNGDTINICDSVFRFSVYSGGGTNEA